MRPLPVYFVDNVITTGTTVAACRRALGWGHGLAYADASTPGNTRSFHSEIPAPVDYRQSSPTTPRAEGQVLREADGGSQLFTHDLMEKEWKAWQRVVSEWPGDINDPRFKRLVKAIQLWGEWLARLREKQRLDLRQGALTKAQVAYEKPQHTNASLCGRSSVRSKERQMT
jgi:hypothetical protein